MRTTKKIKLSDNHLFSIQGETTVLISLNRAKKNRYNYSMSNLSSGVEVSRKNPVNRRAQEINYLSLKTVICNLVLPENYEINTEVLTSDGGTRTCALSGVFSLLKDKKNKDNFYFCAFGIVEDQLVVDMDYKQDSQSSVDVPFGIRKGEINEYIYLQLDGEITPLKLLEGLKETEKQLTNQKEENDNF